MIISSFQGYPLTKMYEQMVEDLNEVLRIPVREEVLKPLKNKVYGKHKDDIFDMNSHEISDSSLWIIKKNKEKRERETRR